MKAARTDNATIMKMRHLIYSTERRISEGIRYRPGTFHRLITDGLLVRRNLSSRHDATPINPDMYIARESIFADSGLRMRFTSAFNGARRFIVRHIIKTLCC